MLVCCVKTKNNFILGLELGYNEFYIIMKTYPKETKKEKTPDMGLLEEEEMSSSLNMSGCVRENNIT